MSAKVVGMDGEPVPMAREPNAACIRALEDLLERARSGEVQGFAGATLDADQCASWHAAGFVGSFGMLGALEVTKAHLMQVHIP